MWLHVMTLAIFAYLVRNQPQSEHKCNQSLGVGVAKHMPREYSQHKKMIVLLSCGAVSRNVRRYRVK